MIWKLNLEEGVYSRLGDIFAQWCFSKHSKARSRIGRMMSKSWEPDEAATKYILWTALSYSHDSTINSISKNAIMVVNRLTRNFKRISWQGRVVAAASNDVVLPWWTRPLCKALASCPMAWPTRNMISLSHIAPSALPQGKEVACGWRTPWISSLRQLYAGIPGQ